MRYSTAVRCPCGAKCAQLYRKDGSWNSRHGSAGLIIRCLPTSEGSRRYRRFGYRSITAARADGDHCGQLLALAADDVTRRKIGDLIAAATGGTPLPAVEDVRRGWASVWTPASRASPPANGWTAGWPASAGPSGPAPCAAMSPTSGCTSPR